MYDAVADPYCYSGTTVLKNLPGIRDQAALDAFEAALTEQRGDEPLPRGRLGAAHYRALHRHLFQDVYAWAGTLSHRSDCQGWKRLLLSREHRARDAAAIRRLKERQYLAHLPRPDFAQAAAEFVSTLNAIHPFREGNGRTQTAFLALLAARAGHPIDLERLRPERFLAAMIASFKGDDTPLEREILLLTASS
jgi:cell filamentation protein